MGVFFQISRLGFYLLFPVLFLNPLLIKYGLEWCHGLFSLVSHIVFFLLFQRRGGQGFAFSMEGEVNFRIM
jgi:hypothetical protein